MWPTELQNVLTAKPHRNDHHWFRTNVLKVGHPEVDLDQGVVRGFAVATKGEALGHGILLDDTFLDSLVEQGNLAKHGIKSRFDHPNASTSSMGSFLGRTFNFSRDGDIVRADLHLSDAARHSPQGNLFDYTLKMAKDEPEMFGASIVFSGASVYQKNEKGDDLTDEPRLARLEKFLATDLVDDPAANPSGLFSSQDSLAATLTDFLDRYFARKGWVAFTTKGESMGNEQEATPQPVDVEAIKLAAVQAERKRIAEINDATQPGQEAFAQTLIEAGTEPDEARKRLLADLKSRRSTKLAELVDHAPESAGGGAQAAAPAKAESWEHLPPTERFAKEYDADPMLRKEFATVQIYQAYREQEELGNVRLYKSKEDMAAR